MLVCLSHHQVSCLWCGLQSSGYGWAIWSREKNERYVKKWSSCCWDPDIQEVLPLVGKTITGPMESGVQRLWKRAFQENQECCRGSRLVTEREARLPQKLGGLDEATSGGTRGADGKSGLLLLRLRRKSVMGKRRNTLSVMTRTTTWTLMGKKDQVRTQTSKNIDQMPELLDFTIKLCPHKERM